MSITIQRTAGGYILALSPPHGAEWSSEHALTAYELMTELSDRDVHWHDAHDAMDEADMNWFRTGQPRDPGWRPTYHAEVLRRRADPRVTLRNAERPRMNRLQRAVAGLVLTLVACTASLPGTPMGIDTAGFQLGFSGCAGFGVPSFRIERDGDALRFVDVGTDDIVRIIWPFGFAARLQDGHAVLYASDGVVIGREGDVVDDVGACGEVDGAILANSVGTRSYR